MVCEALAVTGWLIALSPLCLSPCRLRCIWITHTITHCAGKPTSGCTCRREQKKSAVCAFVVSVFCTVVVLLLRFALLCKAQQDKQWQQPPCLCKGGAHSMFAISTVHEDGRPELWSGSHQNQHLPALWWQCFPGFSYRFQYLAVLLAFGQAARRMACFLQSGRVDEHVCCQSGQEAKQNWVDNVLRTGGFAARDAQPSSMCTSGRTARRR
jgi:hypothetical protein